MSGIRICKNERCVNIVPPSANPGRPKLYCRRKCKDAQGARNAYWKEKGVGTGLQKTYLDLPYVDRYKATTVTAARDKFVKHLTDCPNTTSQFFKTCPSENDTYDTKRLCLIHAVLREDYYELRDKHENPPFVRKVTSDNGFWIEDSEKVARLVAAGEKVVSD